MGDENSLFLPTLVRHLYNRYFVMLKSFTKVLKKLVFSPRKNALKKL